MLRKLLLISTVVAFIFLLAWPFIFKPQYLKEETVAVKPEVKKPVTPEKPLHNVALPNFADIKDIKQKKLAFFSFIRPAVEIQNDQIRKERTLLLKMLEQVSLEEILSDEQYSALELLATRYRVSQKDSLMQQLNALIAKVDEIPTALVLVQAANESAWGTSRFARIGLNFFGIWCYQKGCGMVPRSRNSGANHEVEAFQSVDDAVKRYLHNINTNNAYQVFRTIRQQLREQEQPLIPEILATGLLPYSERGSDYVMEISDMLRHNRQYLTPITTIPATSP
ncbi:glucosaminidase [Thalassotalea sp. M1531]|uniref:Glucosaminidase n=1 Tax=Thalassotalea algicola TaxID=2716224 RepID=A0A7Y0LBX0_9GAMM|nr:glucosaminidase domain-containing protein [Thalassotalea algicola]NMP31462.1 glucosaminidase [Thalassotalea algicola]